MHVIVILTCLGLAHASSGKSWGYGATTQKAYGPADWNKVARECAGSSQSPIDIDSDQAVERDMADLEFKFKGASMVSGNFANNGHAPTFTITSAKTGTLSGGPLAREYKLQQFHFHFGCDEKKGSEHLLNGKAYPAELHLVFYNTKYGDFSTAADKTDGLAVVGVFLQVGRWSNYELWRIGAYRLKSIIKQGSSVHVSWLSLKQLVPQLADGDVKYYTYKGSLTTPNCYESVRWIVLKETLSITKDQLKNFRKLEAEHGFSNGLMCNNFRPPQPLNGRTVSYSD